MRRLFVIEQDKKRLHSFDEKLSNGDERPDLVGERGQFLTGSDRDTVVGVHAGVDGS